jgi:hypothetical protein
VKSARVRRLDDKPRTDVPKVSAQPIRVESDLGARGGGYVRNLIFTFLAVSLSVSAIVEAIASQRGWRAATLIEGVKMLLYDPKFEGLALKMYNHALVNPLNSGTTRGHLGLKNMPSYIDPGEFADALIQITNTASAAPAEIEGAIRQIQDEQLRHLFQGIYDRSEGNVTRMRSELAACSTGRT